MTAAPSIVPPSLTLRAVEAADLPFVRSSWRESHNVRAGRCAIPWRAWKATFGRDMDAILAHPSAMMLIAADDANRIAGWICWSPGKIPALHYVYVRHEYRGGGIGASLFAAAGIGSRLVYTFRGGRRRRAGETFDLTLAQRAQQRGVFASFVDAREFLR